MKYNLFYQTYSESLETSTEIESARNPIEADDMVDVILKASGGLKVIEKYTTVTGIRIEIDGTETTDGQDAYRKLPSPSPTETGEG